MPKVDLDKITLGHSPLTDKIFAGTTERPGVWRNKVDVTNAFIDCVINRWENQKETIQSGENRWEITVKKLPASKKKKSK